MLPEKFTKKQQIRSRLDGGVELDGSVRALLETTKEELLGHHVLEQSRANCRRARPTAYVLASVVAGMPPKLDAFV